MTKTIILAVITAAAPVALVAQGPTAGTGDARHGAQLFLQCRACHVVTPGAPSTVGPNLAGVVGRKAGSLPGYAYSPAMAKAGTTWTATNLDGFIKRPSAVMPGTKMAFAGVADAKNRADIIAYLTTLKTQ